MTCLFACESATEAPVPVRPTPPADAAPVIDAKSIDAAVTVVVPVIPPELASAPAWMFREFETGAIRTRHTLTKYRLHHANGRAAMLVERFESNQGGLTATRIDGFVLKSTELLTGSAETRGKDLAFTLDGKTPMTFTCTTARLAVAKPTATRGRTPGKGGCEGDRGRWVPNATTRVDVLSCWPFDKDDPDPDREEHLAFAAAPGIEFLYVNDDCVIQGGGYRAVAPDGAIADVRPPR